MLSTGIRNLILRTGPIRKPYLIFSQSSQLSTVVKENIDHGVKLLKKSNQPSKITWSGMEADPLLLPIQKRKTASRDETKKHLSVKAYALASEFALKDLSLSLRNHAVYTEVLLPDDLASNALLIAPKHPTPDNSKRDIIVFRNGAAIFWNLSNEEQYLTLEMLNPFRIQPYNRVELFDQTEELPFNFTEKQSHLKGDFIWLHQPKNPEKQSLPSQTVIDQYAYSHALALAVKLNMLEHNFNRRAAYMEPWIEKLRYGRLFFLTQSPVTKHTGELLTLRHLVNVSSDLVDTPEIYWERYEMEPVFNSLKNRLSINSRTLILNQKLDFCCEVLDILTSHLNSRHSSRLEVMIIALILIEVIFEIIHYRNSLVPPVVEDKKSSLEATNNNFTT